MFHVYLCWWHSFINTRKRLARNRTIRLVGTRCSDELAGKNFLMLNSEKSNILNFSIANKPSQKNSIQARSCPHYTKYTPCPCPCISVTSQLKYLGMQIDKHLNWYSHIVDLVSRIRNLIYITNWNMHTHIWTYTSTHTHTNTHTKTYKHKYLHALIRLNVNIM